MDLASLRSALQQQASDLSPSSRKVLDWVLRNTLKIAWTGVEDVAQQVGVSTATVVKTLQQCGFEGYSDVQRKIREQIPDSFLVSRTFQANGGSASTIQQIVENETANLSQLEGCLNPLLPTLLDQLLNARRVFVASSNMTVPVAQYFALHLDLLLNNVSFVDTGNVQSWFSLRSLRSDDCVVGISFPRYSPFSKAFLSQASEKTTKLVLITDFAGPSLPEPGVTVSLPAYSHYYQSSHVSLTALLQILARSFADEAPERIAANLEAADQIRSLFNNVTLRQN